MPPSVTPNARPTASSWRMTRHQSDSLMCPSAMARVMSVAACVPVMPPVAMHSGTKKVSATIWRIEASKLIRTDSVSISARNSTESQIERFHQMVRSLVSR